MSFKLTQKFLSEYEGTQPNWGYGDLSYFVYKRTYARMMDNGLQEEYFDTCRRVTEGVFEIQRNHCKSNRLPWNAHKAQKTAQEFFRRMWAFKWTPPGRGFWIMGTSMVDKIGSAALNNCGAVSTANINIEFGDPFAWTMDMLMLGVGVGFDAKGAGTLIIKKPCKDSVIFDIPDTREGWVESIRLLLNSYQTGSNVVEFLYGKIRPRGEPIKGFGGTASGPEPLEELHNNIRSTLDELSGEAITSVAIVDIMNFIGKCVVAGNVRRSAELAIGDIDDCDFTSMKDVNKFPKELMDRRWASNNSVFATPSSDFSKVVSNMALNGEPGLIFIDNARHHGRFKDGWIPFEDDKYDNVVCFNPCGEQQLEDRELCTLVETYPANHDSVDDYMRTLKFAYMYAKTVSLVPTHDERTNSVMMRNRRIGCSMSGIQQAIKKFGINNFLRNFCDKGYEVIRRWDRIYSRWLGVPRSIRMTTVKPSGSVSLLAGATPGVHYTHAEYYMRAVRLAANSKHIYPLYMSGYKLELAITDNKKLISVLEAISPETLQGDLFTNGEYEDTIFAIRHDGLYSEDGNIKLDGLEVIKALGQKGATIVVYFPIKEKNFTKSKFDTTLWEQLMLVREMQHYWSDNAVSCTITLKEAEGVQLKPAIEAYAPYVKTLSFLPLENHKYVQPPYEECTKQEYEAYSSKLSNLTLDSGESKILGERFCTNDTCSV